MWIDACCASNGERREKMVWQVRDKAKYMEWGGDVWSVRH